MIYIIYAQVATSFSGTISSPTIYWTLNMCCWSISIFAQMDHSEFLNHDNFAKELIELVD